MVVAAGLHAITARAHVAPASAVVTALVDEQPSAILGAALANSPEPIASEQPCRAVQDREENLLQTVGDTGPLCFDPVLQLLLIALAAGVLVLFPSYYYLFRVFNGEPAHSADGIDEDPSLFNF